MKVNRIITATLLSAGLIVGTSSAVHAAGPTSVATPTVTMPTYQTQLVAYKRVLSTYASVVAAFKVQVVVFGNAVQTYKASHGVSLDAYKAASNTAITTYTNATVAFKAQLARYETAVKSYDAAYTTAVKSYMTTVRMREKLRNSINIAFRTAIHNANALFANAIANATTVEQKLAATNVHKRVAALAKKVRKARLHALGARPVRPIKQIKTYKTAYGVSLDVYRAVIKANFPVITPAHNGSFLTSNNTAITADTRATAAFNAQLAIYETAVKGYDAGYAIAVKSNDAGYAIAVQNYDALVTKREDLRKAIDVAFETAIQNANAVFATASTIATTADQKLAATNARQSAVDLAKTVRKARLHAVGAKPVRPIKRMKFNNRIKNFNADKPVRPVKPAKATNANKH
jgi:hypothetical protein